MTAYKYQTKKGIRWEYLTNYVDYDGQKRQKHQQGFKTKKEALEAERVFLTTKKFDNDTPLRAMIPFYTKRLKRENTLINMKTLFNLAEPLLDLPIASITEEKVRDLFDGYSWNPRSYNGYATRFCSFYNFSAKRCGVPTRLSIHVPAPKREYQIYTLEEYKLFSSYLDQVGKVFFDLLFFTGIRKGEALALTKQDISDVVSITKSRSSSGTIGSPKTVSSIRKIALPAFLKEELDEYMKALPTDQLFPLTEVAFYHRQKKAEKLSGLHHIRLHDFRHSHASFLIAQNVNIADIARRLGHANIGVTLSVYSHLYKNNDSTIASLLDFAVRNP